MNERINLNAVVRAWIDKADADYRAVQLLMASGKDCPLDIVCFQAQQCVEKYLKATLCAKGVDFPKIHDIGELVGFPVVFQCKRYKGSVSPSQVRDFRGAMAGRADKGLVITTGTFTSEAKAEAKRSGDQPIDLINGWQLAELLKNLKLGIVTEQFEKVRIDSDWFAKEFSTAN